MPDFLGMEAESGLVEHVQRVDQAGAQGLGQPDPLELTCRERPRGAVERQVIEPDLRQVAETAIELSQDGSAGGLAPEAGLFVDEATSVANRQGRERGDVAPPILTAKASGRSRVP